MARKRWTPREDVTPALLKFREKRKWQINLRRYVIQQSPCPEYAPYFGLDIRNLRQWFEYQFTPGLDWENFGKAWQFEHIIPLSYFDFSNDNDLRLAWNFTNLRVDNLESRKGANLDLVAARKYFNSLFESTGYAICQKQLAKLETIPVNSIDTTSQEAFINDHREYLLLIEGYSNYEFELLNSGRSVEEIKKEVEFLKNIGRNPG